MGYEWKDSLRGAGKGAMAGSFGGPIGMLIGALTGGTIGGFGDDLDKRVTGDSQNNITDQMLSFASMAGSMGGAPFGGVGSGGAGSFGGAGGSPSLEFGNLSDGSFLGDLGGAFGHGGGGMTTQMPMPNFLSPEELGRQNSMQSFDWSNILKMLGSSGMGQGGEQPGQPATGGMVPRMPVPIAPVMSQPVRGEGYYQTWLQKNNLV